jgi:hypothetical protein
MVEREVFRLGPLTFGDREAWWVPLVRTESREPRYQRERGSELRRCTLVRIGDVEVHTGRGERSRIEVLG